MSWRLLSSATRRSCLSCCSEAGAWTGRPVQQGGGVRAYCAAESETRPGSDVTVTDDGVVRKKGRWVESQLEQMESEKLHLLSALVEEDSLDLYRWVTGQEEPPQTVQENSVFQDLCWHVKNRMAGSTSSKTPQGAEWLRGWMDKGNQ